MNYAFVDTTYKLETHRIGDWANFQILLYYYMPPPPPVVFSANVTVINSTNST
jgi:hypothetical protein